jgi:hypothetical protein
VYLSLGKFFSEFEQKVIVNEIQYALKRVGGELENIHFDEELCTILSIIPIQIPVQKLYDEIIRECNQYGDFVNSDYIITNVKIITNSEIRRMTGRFKKQNPED